MELFVFHETVLPRTSSSLDYDFVDVQGVQENLCIFNAFEYIVSLGCYWSFRIWPANRIPIATGVISYFMPTGLSEKRSLGIIEHTI